MGQFPVTPTREKVLAKYPDYSVTITPAKQSVSVFFGDIEVAASSQALVIKESMHKDVYYLPRQDVNLSLFTKTQHSTYCPFKGHACYWSLNSVEPDAGHTGANIVWSYEAPYPEVSGLKDYLSFYVDRTRLAIRQQS